MAHADAHGRLEVFLRLSAIELNPRPSSRPATCVHFSGYRVNQELESARAKFPSSQFFNLYNVRQKGYLSCGMRVDTAMLHRRFWITVNLSATALLISLNCIFVGIIPAQQESSEIAQSPTTPLRVATRLVQINVIVNDKRGNPIEGLTKNDFELFDNKKKQEIRVLSAHSNRPLDRLALPLPLDTFTNRTADAATPENVTVILLDSLNTEFADQVLARKHVVKFLRQLRSNDHVALYWLSNDLYVLHDFTTDAASLRETLATFGGESNHGLADSKVEDPSLNNPNASIPAGRMSSREAFRRAFDQRVANESIKDRVRLTVAALIAIAHHIGPINGRKNLVWVSGSFPFDLGNDKFDLNWANDTGTSFSGDIEMAARAVTDANIAVYPVDARGLMGDDISATQGSGDRHRSSRQKVMNTFQRMPLPGILIR